MKSINPSPHNTIHHRQNILELTLIKFVLFSQNAEMSFNFGAQPFKHDPESGYIAVCNAPKENVKHNEVGTAGTSSQNKSIKNAPQAIIIEVMYKTGSYWKVFM
jgi:hypothetical protein